ncbi:MAG TPA: cation transporter [Thiolapillus brandeum]|uniref:Cation transporter n=1 Tax=Thiolapillus brandeum TaxID=1076588 RepID=A0A831JSM8_9GAMM|nr:cation transporter [Thiolapillus brandeum]
MTEHHHHHSSERIGIAFFLNLMFTIIEFIGGFLTNSTAIMADAVHDLGDTLSIGLGWLLDKLGKREADHGFTYGYRRLSLLGALINGTILIVGSLWVLSEAVPRLLEPQMPDAVGMTGLAILGVTVNGYAAYKLSGGKSLNEQMLNWHLMEDVLGWVAVLIVSIVLLFADWPILDPILSIVFTLFILFSVIKRLAQTIRLFMQAAPDNDITKSVKKTLLELNHVADIHHLHIWSLDGEHHVLTAHLLLDTPVDKRIHTEVKDAVQEALDEYDFSHSTIELEQSQEICRDRQTTHKDA